MGEGYAGGRKGSASPRLFPTPECVEKLKLRGHWPKNSGAPLGRGLPTATVVSEEKPSLVTVQETVKEPKRYEWAATASALEGHI